MPDKRIKLSAERKAELIARALATPRHQLTLADLAAEYGIHPSYVSRLVIRAKKEGKADV